VDDFIMAAKSMSTIQSLIAQVKARLPMSDQPLTVCLGINFTDNRDADNSVSIDLDAFADKMTAKFEEHIPGGRAVNTPIRHDIHYDRKQCPKTEEEQSHIQDKPYRSAIGSMMYLVNAIRVDAIFATNREARFMDNPGLEHWEAVQHTLKYIASHPHAKIQYSSNIPEGHKNVLIAYVDVNWEKHSDDCRSTTGWIIFFNGGPIAWCCAKQKSASGSSAESEYKAVYDVVTEIIWLRHLLIDMGYPLDTPTVIYEDSQSCIKFADNPIQLSSMKHIDPKYHAVRQYVEQGQVYIDKIDTKDNMADMCTKALPHLLHNHFRHQVLRFPQAEDQEGHPEHKRTRNNA
jgi:hypothetical protein